MNWKKEAENDLKSYAERVAGIINLKERIANLEEDYISLKGRSSSDPVAGGMSKQEDKLIANIDERERLKFALKNAEYLVGLTEKALNSLRKKDKYILTMFYIDRPSDYKDRLCIKFGVEEAQIYRLKNEALRKFTLAMYGIVEL